MRELLASGRIVDLALVVIVVEFAVLLVASKRGTLGARALDLVGPRLAGAFLLLALRAALTGEDYRWTLVFLTASFPAHILDTVRRARTLG
jgi:hypothetical protein